MEDEEPLSRSQVWLRHVEFMRGGRYLIEAESGTGKSSLLSFIYGNRTDYRGEIYFDDMPARSLSVGWWSHLRTSDLSILPQEMRLFPELTVMENIRIKNRLTLHKTDSQIRSMLDRVELGAKADTPVALLSVGQQQRVAIVRALCQPFSFLLLDEPVSHLDARNNAIVSAMILDEATAQQAAIISTSVGNPLTIPDATVIRM